MTARVLSQRRIFALVGLGLALVTAHLCRAERLNQYGKDDAETSLTAAGVATAKAAEPPLGRIVFLRKDEIYACQADGAGQAVLVRGEDLRSPPVWSPSGDRFTWIAAYEIRLFDMFSRKETTVTLPVTGTGHGKDRLNPSGVPAWDETGQWIFVGGLISPDIDSDGGLWQVSAGGKAESRMLIPPLDADAPLHTHPKLSRDARYIASGYRMAGLAGIRIYDRRTGREVRPNSSPALQLLINHHLDYEWLTDETLLVACDTKRYEEWQGERGPGGIWAWDITTGDVRKWLDTSQAVDSLSLSPDGKRLAYILGGGFTSVGKPESKRLQLYDLSRRQSRTVIRGYTEGWPPLSWAPDSRHIAFAVADKPDSPISIWVVDVLRSSKRKVADNAVSPSWLPR